MAERSRRTGISQDRVIAELAKLAFVNPYDVIDPSDASIREDASPDDLACIQSVKVKRSTNEFGSSEEREVKLYDKKASLELLGRHLGIWNDKLNVTGTVPVVIMGEDDLED
jgi:phage terminase small subunit